MKKLLFLVTIFAFLFLISCNEEAPVEQNSNSDASLSKKSYAFNNSYILVGNSNNLPSDLENSISNIGGVITKKFSKIGIAVVTSDASDFISKASKIKGVGSIVPNYSTNWIEAPTEAIAADFGNPPVSGDDDFFFDLQWGHDAIDAPEAWDEGFRGAGVRVAVLDGGFDLDHPDLAPNINLGLSMDFTGEGLQYLYPDPFSHGSHTAGTIAAADNGFGTIGVAPEAELVLVKVLGDNGNGSFADVMAGIIYAADVEADVISMSLSGDFYIGGKEIAALKVAMSRVTTYAYQKGSTIIAAASNDAIDRDHDANYYVTPADDPNVISVSATGPNGWGLDPNTNLDLPAYYTNYGQSAIDFAGPGGTIDFDLANSGASATVAGLTRPAYVFDFVFSTGNNSWYWSIGTSMATPHVAGVAALIIGKNGGSMHPAQVKAKLKQSADDLGKPGKDDFYGAGRVNAYRAVTQ